MEKQEVRGRKVLPRANVSFACLLQNNKTLAGRFTNGWRLGRAEKKTKPTGEPLSSCAAKIGLKVGIGSEGAFQGLDGRDSAGKGIKKPSGKGPEGFLRKMSVKQVYE